MVIFFAAAPSQGQIPYGLEFQVNSYSNDDQCRPRIASLGGDRFVICWESLRQDGSGWGIFGQLFSASLGKIGNEFQANSYSNGYQADPQIAPLSKGGYVICWDSEGQDGSGGGIFGQVYSASGEKLGSEFQANTSITDHQRFPSLVPLSGGNFVIWWVTEQNFLTLGFFGQVFSPSGTKIGREFQIYPDSIAEVYQVQVIAAPLCGDAFVICYQGFNPNRSALETYGQLFSANGERVGKKFRINTNFYMVGQAVAPLLGVGFVTCWPDSGANGAGLYGQVFSPNGEKEGNEFFVDWDQRGNIKEIATLVNGDFVVWRQANWGYGSGAGVFGQVFSANGEKKGNTFQVNSYTSRHQYFQQIAPLSDGGFIICWLSASQDRSGIGIYGQLFSSNGEKVGEEFRANTFTYAKPWELAIAPLSHGDYVICWTIYAHDGSGREIFAKRFPSSPLHHPLRPFELLEPNNDASITTFEPILRWQQPSDQIVCYSWELQYKIFYDDNSEFSSPDTVGVDRDTTVALPSLQPGTTYFWKVLAKNVAGDSLWSSNTNAFFVRHDATLVENKQAQPPGQFVLQQNYPNPFNPETTIRYELPGSGFVTVKVYDITGRMVKVLVSGWQTAGTQHTIWDGTDFDRNLVAAGIYICWIEFTGEDGKKMVQSKKMSLVK